MGCCNNVFVTAPAAALQRGRRLRSSSSGSRAASQGTAQRGTFKRFCSTARTRAVPLRRCFETLASRLVWAGVVRGREPHLLYFFRLDADGQSVHARGLLRLRLSCVCFRVPEASLRACGVAARVPTEHEKSFVL